MRKTILFATVAAFTLSPALAQQADDAATGEGQELQAESQDTSNRGAQAETRSFDQVMAADDLSDQDFVTHAGMSDVFEIEAARIAAEQAESEEVRQFAQRLLEDHRQAGQELAAAAQEADVQVAVVNRLETEAASDIEATGTIPEDDAAAADSEDQAQSGQAQSGQAESPEAGAAAGEQETAESDGMMEPDVDIGRSSMLDPEHEQKLEELRQASGEEFDRLFLEMQVEAHEQAISLFERYAEEGQSQPLQRHAEQTLAALEDHLQEARNLQDERG